MLRRKPEKVSSHPHPCIFPLWLIFHQGSNESLFNDMLFWGKMCYFATNSKKILLGKEKLNMEVRMQGKKLYVGNLNYKIEQVDLEEIFAEYGEVVSARIITDRETRKSKGFGFVEMANEEEGRKAIGNSD